VTSRHNNALDGITGLLWSDGQRFIQALEGPRASVEATFLRIARDNRHHSLDLLSDRMTDEREFGTWNMEHRRTMEELDEHDWRVHRCLRQASAGIRDQFLSLISVNNPVADRTR
jgi:hypothetical protein